MKTYTNKFDLPLHPVTVISNHVNGQVEAILPALHPGIIAWGEYKVRTYGRLVRDNWHNEWSSKSFRRTFVLILLILPVILFSTNYFFNYIQDSKTGVLLNDLFLKWLPAKNVSIPITFFMSSVIILCVLRCISNPRMFTTALMALSFLLIARMLTISITRFFAPAGLIELKDPICNLMYGSRCITRDLFFSGHTATLFILYLCSVKKVDKYYILFAVVSVGFLLLVQHVHYTVDVLCAPFFAFGCFWISKRIMKLQGANAKSK